MAVLRADQARRIALAAQGFDRPRPTGRVDVRHLRRLIGRVDLLQIDAVQTVERAQYLPLFSRLGPYPRDLLDAAAYQHRELFEAWAHEASLVAIERWPALGPRRSHWASRRAARLEAQHPGFIAATLDEVAERGPLTVSDLRAPGERTGPWWGWSPGKAALEALFAWGDVAIADRQGQTRRYDLTERVIPPGILELPAMDTQEAYRTLLLIGADALGVGTADDMIDYYRLHGPTARPIIERLVLDGLLEPVEVAGWDRLAYRAPTARLPRRIGAAALLAPFDPVVWHRPRVARLFGFHYRLEFYVPAAQRRYGYYVMPFLLGDELVARVDVKADRKARVLRVPGAFVEEAHMAERVAPPLLAELRALAAWLGLDEVRIGDRGSLCAALSALGVATSRAGMDGAA